MFYPWSWPWATSLRADSSRGDKAGTWGELAQPVVCALSAPIRPSLVLSGYQHSPFCDFLLCPVCGAFTLWSCH